MLQPDRAAGEGDIERLTFSKKGLMKKFMLIHYGFEQPTPEIMAAWKADPAVRDEAIQAATRRAIEVPLAVMKEDHALDGMLILRRGNRLSITPVDGKHFRRICKLGGWSPKKT